MKQPIKFLGAYVVNVSCSLGWGGETSNCSVTLVNDKKAGVTFAPPKLGTACLLQINPDNKKTGFFKFGGILQRWTEKTDPSSGTTYEVILESPSKVLDGVIVVLDKFQGTVYQTDSALPEAMPIMAYGANSPTNFINLFAYKENTQVNGLGGIFGGSNVDSVGYPAYTLNTDIATDITNAMSNYFYTDNYLIGRFGGEIYYGETIYWLDLSELYDEMLPYLYQYRISGDFMDMNSLLKNITDHCNYDYLLTVDGVPNKNGVIIKDAVIKVRVLSRNTPPTPGAIVNLVNELKSKPDGDKILQSYSVGIELSDTITQKMIIGDQVSRYWVSSKADNQLLPIWGRAQISDQYGPRIEYLFTDKINYYGDDWANNCLKPVRIVADGGYSNNFTFVDTNLLELRAAMSGKETWKAYQLLAAIAQGKTTPFFGTINFGLQQFKDLLNGKALPQDLASTDLESAEDWALVLLGADPAKVEAHRRLEARFQNISKVAGEFFGTEFFVKVPGELGGVANTIKYIDDGTQAINAWDIAESAWSGQYLRTLFTDINSYDDRGRLKSFAVYDNFENADYSALGNNYTFVPEGVATHEVNFEKEIIWQNIEGVNSLTGQPDVYSAGFVKCKVPIISLNDRFYTEINGFSVLCQLIFGVQFPQGEYNSIFGKEILELPFCPLPLPPKYIGVPQQSNRYVWGPWFSFNLDSGIKGKLDISQDTNFSPESFGSIEAMNFNAQTMVNAQIAAIYEQETGYIELAEIPTCALGDRFVGSGPYVTNMSINIGSDGMKTTYQFSTWTRSFGQFAKYNIDRMMNLKKNSYKFYKDLRDLFKLPAPKAFNRSLFGKLEKAARNGFPNIGVQNVGMNFGAYGENYAKTNLGSQSSQTSNSTTTRGLQSVNPNTTNDPSIPVPGPTGKRRITGQAGTLQNNMQAMSKNYDSSFSCSIEQLYSPIVCFDQTNPSGLQKFETRSPNSGLPETLLNPTGDLPCFSIAISGKLGVSGLNFRDYVSPTSMDLDPYFNFGDSDFTHVSKDNRETTKDLNVTKDPIKFCVKTVGMRGPLLLSGWGFDTAGLPVPSSGSETGNMWSYMQDTPVDRKLWKTGPVDLRWHDARKVWVGGHEMLEGILTEDLAAPDGKNIFKNYTEAKMEIYRRSIDSYHDTKKEYITITNVDPSLSAGSGSYVMVADINYEWRPVWVGCLSSNITN